MDWIRNLDWDKAKGKIKEFFHDLPRVNKSLFIVLSLYLVFQCFFGLNTPEIMGDGREYLAISAAWINHYSPDIREEDIQKCHQILADKKHHYHHPSYQEISDFLAKKSKPLESHAGIFKSTTGKHYSYHFWFYSLISVPAYSLLKIFGANPVKMYQVTNAWIIIMVWAYILWFSKLSDIRKTAAMVLFFFCGNMWYIAWSHPEIFSTGLLFLALLLLHDKRYTLSTLIAAIAAWQNPPIAFLLPLIILRRQYHHFDIKKLLIDGAIGSICLVPTLFYYYHFKVPNLIIYIGAVSREYMTFGRFFSLFFDLNQGMILSIPLILPVFLILVIINIARKQWNYSLFLPLLIILMALPSIQQKNWNMGESIICRYALWLSMIIIFYLVTEIEWQTKTSRILLGLIIVVQLSVVYGFGAFSVNIGKYIEFNKLSVWVLDNKPSWYNPDPEIFAERAMNREKTLIAANSPIIYKDKAGTITKILVHQDHLKNLSIAGISPSQMEQYKENLSFQHKWAYIDLK